MRFEKGYPKVNGASDYEDSSHLAGILAIFEHPQALNLTKYFDGKKYMRCPDSKYDFSRDQAILLMAGLLKQGSWSYVDLKFINGKDILPPSVRGLAEIAKTGKPYWFQKLWLKAEIYWHSYIQPLDEPFQIIALCMTYGDEYLKLWTEKNTLWAWSIRRYLSQLDGAWRNEPELAEFVIDKIKEKIST